MVGPAARHHTQSEEHTSANTAHARSQQDGDRTESPVLALQRAVGNRAAQHALPAQSGAAHRAQRAPASMILRWPWSRPEQSAISSVEEPEEERQMPGPGIVTEPTEGGSTQTYTLAREEERVTLLGACDTSLDSTAGLYYFVNDRNEEDQRLARLERIEVQLQALMREIAAQQPWSVEALTRSRGEFERLDGEQEAIGHEVLTEAFPPEVGAAQDTRVIERRVREDLRRLEQRRRTLEVIVQAMRGREEAAAGIRTGMQLIRALELLDAAVGQDLLVLGGEAMGLAGQAGPFVGTSGGTAVTVIDLIQSSGLAIELGVRDAWVHCIQGDHAIPSECLLLTEQVASDPGTFIAEIGQLTQRIEDDMRLLRSVRQ